MFFFQRNRGSVPFANESLEKTSNIHKCRGGKHNSPNFRIHEITPFVFFEDQTIQSMQMYGKYAGCF